MSKPGLFQYEIDEMIMMLEKELRQVMMVAMHHVLNHVLFLYRI